jgi:hypothetical protein
MRSPVWAATALALATAGTAAADVAITYKVTEDGQPKGASAQYITAEKMRLDDPDHDLIVEFASGKMTMVDKKKNEYFEVTRDEMVRAAEAMQKKMDEAMAKMPPAMREKMAGAMGGGGGLLAVTVGTGSRKIAGYDAHPYTVTVGTVMQRELWAAEIPIPQPAVDAQASLALLAAPMMKNAAKAVEEMKKVKGFPLYESTTVKVLKSKTTVKEATEVKTSAVDPKVFVIDTTKLKKVESPFAKMMKSAQ